MNLNYKNNILESISTAHDKSPINIDRSAVPLFIVH